MKKNKEKKSNIKIHWALICKSASVDQNTNMLSVFNVVEELGIKNENNQIELINDTDFKQKINIPTEYNLVISCEKCNLNEDFSSPELKIILKDHKEEILMDNIFPVRFEADKKRLRTIVSFNNLLVTGVGEYSYIVGMRGNSSEDFEDNLVEIKFEVKLG